MLHMTDEAGMTRDCTSFNGARTGRLPQAKADGRIKGRNVRPLAAVVFRWIMKHFPKVRVLLTMCGSLVSPWSPLIFRNVRFACLRPQGI
ncbi:hypothetical protein X732_11635 [Mesorhizobium sp. L2C066B000]|nr:hypothetical protein X732_11635 [Mesorhizobium sp. L2C066B000]